MFSSSLLGAMYRPSISVLQGPNGRIEQIVREPLIIRLAGMLGLSKRTVVTSTSIRHRDGYCYIANLPETFMSQLSENSTLALYENGQRLPYSESLHDDISVFGRGRYSCWENHLYFSSSDNSDPTTNGRRYQIVAE